MNFFISLLKFENRALLAGLLAISVALTGPITQAEDLPELGDSATQYLNPRQEKQIGQAFLRRLINSPSFLADYELQHYLQALGDSIGQHADLLGTRLTFNLVKDNDLNAFAVPGGYITFNTGLVLSTDNESELASVLAHEIAHLTQRHLPKLIARANQNRLPAIAAIIGSILIGGQAGATGVTLTSAAMASDRLAFTRDFEREADSIGIRLLAESGYDPNSMVTFFGKLEKHTGHDSAGVPEFLRTHPLSFTRIAESEVRAQSYPEQKHASSFEYFLAKARIRALYVERQKDSMPYFLDQIESGSAEIKDAAKYGIAIAYTQNRKFDKAREFLAGVLSKYPEHPWIQSAWAELNILDNQVEEGIEGYLDTIVHHPDQRYLSYRLAEAYLFNNQPSLAKKVLRYQIRRHRDDYRLYQLLSKANAGLGNVAEAHQANAEYFAILGNYKKAITSIELALKESGTEGYLGQSLAARLKDLKEKLALQKKIG